MQEQNSQFNRAYKHFVEKADELEFQSVDTNRLEDIVLLRVREISIADVQVIKLKCPKLATLKYLKLNEYEIMVEDNLLIQHICSIPSITSLSIQPYDLNQSIKHIAKMKQLKSLKLRNQHFEINCLKPIADNLVGLEELSLFSFTYQNYNILNLFSQLKSFELNYVTISNGGVNAIINSLTKLQSLSFQHCAFANPQQLVRIHDLKHLTTFSLAHCNINRQNILKIFSESLNLISLNLSDTIRQFNCEDIRFVLKQCSNLKHVIFDDNHLSNQQIKAILQSTNNLEQLSIFGSQNLTLYGIPILLTHPNIINLNLKSCRKITEKAVKYICQLKSLQQLKLSWCSLTNNGIILLSKLKNMKNLHIQGNTISSLIFLKLIKNFKKCIKIYGSDHWSKYSLIYNTKPYKEQKKQITKCWLD